MAAGWAASSLVYMLKEARFEKTNHPSEMFLYLCYNTCCNFILVTAAIKPHVRNIVESKCILSFVEF